jgi:hypothetical protein
LRLSPRPGFQGETDLELVYFIKRFSHKTLQLVKYEFTLCILVLQIQLLVMGTNSSLYKACKSSQHCHDMPQSKAKTVISPSAAQWRRLESCAPKILQYLRMRFSTIPVRKVIKFCKARKKPLSSLSDGLTTSRSFEWYSFLDRPRDKSLPVQCKSRVYHESFRIITIIRQGRLIE